MAKKRFARVSVAVWNDKKFQGLSVVAKLIFFFLLTTQHLTLLGLIPFQKEAIAKVCGLSKRQFTAGFDELIQCALIEYDPAGLVWLRNFLKHSSPDSPTVVLAWGHASDLCPECSLKDKVLAVAGEYCLSRGDEYLRAFLKVFPDRCPRVAMDEGRGNCYPDKKKNSENENKKIDEKNSLQGCARHFHSTHCQLSGEISALR